MEKIKIGFFGDSFCCRNKGMMWENETYIRKLEKHYQATVVNLGVGGSSIWDVLLVQLNPFIKTDTIPDICVFVWTEHSRIFHKTIRHINSGSAKKYKNTDKVWSTANDYYDHLFDDDLAKLQYTSALEYFDNNMLTKFPPTTKIVHLWSFGNFAEWKEESFKPENITYLHTWKNGIEIQPPLMTFALEECNTLDNFLTGNAKNHIGDKEINDKIFNLIKTAIDAQCVN